jgi:hypothetical protein
MSALEAEITTDGRTVWINRPILIGRFCPISGEVVVGRDVETRVHPDKKPGQADWEWFKARMLEEHRVDVEDSFRPGYVSVVSANRAI